MSFQFTLRRKLVGSSLSGLIFVLVVGLTGVVASGRLADASAQGAQIESALKSQMHADMMHDALRGDVLRAQLAGMKHDQALAQEVRKDLDEHLKMFRDSLAELDAMALDADVRASRDKLKPALDAYMASAVEVVNLSLTDTSAADAKLPGFQAAFKRVEDDMGAFDDLIESRAKVIGEASTRTASIARWAIVATALLSGVVLMLIGTAISRSIARPITEATQVAQTGPPAISRRTSSRAAAMKSRNSCGPCRT